MSTSGLKIGGRVAARQMSKQAAKEAAKQTAKKATKHATKEGLKPATKQNEKIVKTHKNKTPSSSKKDKKNSAQTILKTRKRQEIRKTESKQLKPNENFNCLSSTEDDITSMISPPFVPKSKKVKSKLDFRCQSVLNDGSDLKTESTHQPTPTTKRLFTVPTAHFKDVSTTSDNKFLETNELNPINACEKSSDKTFDFHRKVLEKNATEKLTLPIRQPENLKLLPNNSCNPQIPEDYQRLELLKGEALKEVKDTEFNLMLLRLAKYLLVDTEEAKDIRRKGHNKGNKGFQWLEALRLVFDSDASLKNSKIISNKQKRRKRGEVLNRDYSGSSTFNKTHAENTLIDEGFDNVDETKEVNEYRKFVDDGQKFKTYSAAIQLDPSSISSESQPSSSCDFSERCRNVSRLENLIRISNNYTPSCHHCEDVMKNQTKYMEYKRTKLPSDSSRINKQSVIQPQTSTNKHGNSYSDINLCYLTVPISYFSASVPILHEEPIVFTNILIDSCYPYIDEVYW
ncbi:hypothetical protein MN116_001254 [Schistosoma mekongi]|uniref:Uncharacterized protein n=1 Tax=Schistosoma mekongi TaxID=38744 RepID=A0AAE2D9F7_SCHME|nr:hypothetical protein MN116_001254 [Schistosoma mekongi]